VPLILAKDDCDLHRYQLQFLAGASPLHTPIRLDPSRTFVVHVSVWVWVLFASLVLAMLALDLGALRTSRREPQEITLRSAALWSGAWIGLGLCFSLVVLALYGSGPALAYLTAYVLEKSLSVDNIFVFVLIFSELQIPPAQQRRVLYWGIVGALAARALLIAVGIYLLERFHWVIYPFAALIILAAGRLLWGREKERELVVGACAVCTSWVARFIPITPLLRGGQFWIRQNGRLVVTPLFVALIVVETTDVIFALDSIPAVFAVTREPFLVYTSNVFAMLGLRSLYFLLAGIVDRFRYLRVGLAAILLFVAGKMLSSEIVDVPTWVSLFVIAGALALAVTASLLWAPRPAELTLTGRPGTGVRPSR
jgi:tellurite resistance protein TerC